jgi:hypothetical protein
MTDELIQKKWDEFCALLRSTRRRGINDLITWLEGTDFKIAPASTRYHNCFQGGLLDHSLNVLYLALEKKDFIKFFGIKKRSIILTCLLHDICKVNYYKTEQKWRKDEHNQWESYDQYGVDEAFPLGHAEKSIIIVQQFIKLDDLEVAMIRNHMGFAKDDPTNVSHLFSKYPEALLVHNADMEATFILESPDLQEDLKEKIHDGYGLKAPRKEN